MAAAGHVSRAAAHSGQASAAAGSALGESSAAGSKAIAGVVAVPVTGSGGVVRALGESTAAVGHATEAGGAALWDFAAGPNTPRPKLDRRRVLPPPANRQDPAPAAALRGDH